MLFLGNCEILMKKLQQSAAEGKKLDIIEATPVLQDIYELSKDNNFTFSYISRNCTRYVDQLAKKAMISHQNYVISRVF